MLILSYLLVSALLVINNFALAITSEEYSKFLQTKEEVSNFNLAIQLKFVEQAQRRSQKFKIDIKLLENKLLAHFKKQKISVIKTSSIQPLPVTQFIVEVNFLGMYKTSSGRWIGKSILTLKRFHQENRSYEKESNFGVNIPFRGGNRAYRRYKSNWEDQVIAQTMKKLSSRIIKRNKELSWYFKRVVAYGNIPAKSIDKVSKKKAMYNAFSRACEKAWGVKMQNISELIDYGETSDKVRVSGQGWIYKPKLMKEYTKLTDDGELFVVIEVITGKDKR